MRSEGILVIHQLVARHQDSFHPHPVRKHPHHVTLEAVGGFAERPGARPHQSSRHRGTLPEAVMVGLGHRRGAACVSGSCLAAGVMRTVKEITEHADELAAKAEAYEPKPGDHERVSPLTRVRLAAMKRAAVEVELSEAVRQAHDSGVSWKRLGEVLGTSGEAVRQGYGA